MLLKICLIIVLFSFQARASLTTFPASAEIVSEPLGVVLVISAWNYPFRMSKCPTLNYNIIQFVWLLTHFFVFLASVVYWSCYWCNLCGECCCFKAIRTSSSFIRSTQEVNGTVSWPLRGESCRRSCYWNNCSAWAEVGQNLLHRFILIYLIVFLIPQMIHTSDIVEVKPNMKHISSEFFIED